LLFKFIVIIYVARKENLILKYFASIICNN